ncbi:MAG: iron-sulfur cluster assembly scaffold protein [Deltaproteobacteria bacterium]|nr:iron-sulfur cluster assembly scaffold protein [Deltaproteobacteria bacterium]
MGLISGPISLIMIPMDETLQHLLMGTAVLTALVLIWFLVYYWLSPHVDDPDGHARITGSCGDTMEISLKFKRGRVTESAYWTDGCAYSLNCVCAAAELAKGRTPDELIEIDTETIRRSVGDLPRDQIHCAALSAETLYAALEDHMLKQRKEE